MYLHAIAKIVGDEGCEGWDFVRPNGLKNAICVFPKEKQAKKCLAELQKGTTDYDDYDVVFYNRDESIWESIQ